MDLDENKHKSFDSTSFGIKNSKGKPSKDWRELSKDK